MSKQKKIESNGVAVQDNPIAAQLALVGFDLDNVDDVETGEDSTQSTEPERIQTEAPVPDSDEAILKTIDTFDVKFSGDPLKSDYAEIGREIHDHVESPSDAQFWLRVAGKIHDVMVKEKNLAPASYKRRPFI